MSKYTTEVRFVCEYNAGLTESKGYQNIEEILNECWDKIFDFEFPIFDETYKPVLCKKILKHFYTREIGEETVGLWKLRLDMRMNEIMPYYNKLYESELIQFNPMYDVDLTRDHTLESNGTREYTDNGTVNGTSHDVTKYSDTPQGSLQNVESGEYLTDATIVDGTNSGTSRNTGDSSTTNMDEYLEHVVGKNGGRSYSSLLKEFRETFLNIDMMIIEELDDLFMQIW